MSTDIIRTAQTRSQQINACLELLREVLPIQRRVVHAGDVLYRPASASPRCTC